MMAGGLCRKIKGIGVECAGVIDNCLGQILLESFAISISFCMYNIAWRGLLTVIYDSTFFRLDN